MTSGQMIWAAANAIACAGFFWFRRWFSGAFLALLTISIVYPSGPQVRVGGPISLICLVLAVCGASANPEDNSQRVGVRVLTTFLLLVSLTGA